MIVGLTAIAAGILALLYVVYPLLRTKRRWASELIPEELQTTLQLGDLLTRQRETYAALDDLNLDLQSGSLDIATYEVQSRRYERRALALLKALDLWEVGVDTELKNRRAILKQDCVAMSDT